MTAYTNNIPLEYDPIYDDPQPDTVLTARIMRGSKNDILRAEQEFGRSAVFCPRKTDRGRSCGRSRKMVTRTMFQWPGYVFVHTKYATHDFVSMLASRFSLVDMLDTVPTLVPVSQLQPSRYLERQSALDCIDPDDLASLPPLPAVGDLVSVAAGRWASFLGTVIEVRNGMVVVDVPTSPISVRASPRAVTVVDRKKVLA